MPQVRTPAASPSDGILAAVADGEHFRRRRQLTRALSGLMPAVTAGLLVSAFVIRIAHAPVALFWVLLLSAAAGVALFAWLTARVPAVNDRAAARVDADAQLGGELRSALWFTSQPAGDAWAAYHLDRAAARVQEVSWPAVYPPVPAPRAWAGSAVLGVLAIALVSIHAWPLASWTLGSAAGPAGTKLTPAGHSVSADVQKQIDELLKAVGTGELPMDEARERLSDLRDALSKVDPALQAAAAKAAQDQPKKPGSGAPKVADEDVEDLAARAEKAASDAALPEDVKWSLEDMAAKLAKAARQGKPSDSATPAESQNAHAEAGKAPASAGAAPPGEMVRMTTAEAQTDPMMASRAAPMSGDPQGGGGEAARKTSASAPLDLSGALRKAAIEAAADSEGANVLAEMRRKSEQSRSTLAFSHVAPLAAYDPSRATAPPPPPDALRPLVQQYFIRR
jgi:hypothetical protein